MMNRYTNIRSPSVLFAMVPVATRFMCKFISVLIEHPTQGRQLPVDHAPLEMGVRAEVTFAEFSFSLAA